MAKLLVISDVHSNLQALEAVLKDAEHYAPYDAHLCAGDIVGCGPQPNEVIEVLRQQGFISVMGNHDRAVERANEDLGPIAKKALEMNVRELSAENRRYISSLSTLYVDSTGQFAMVHGSFTHDAEKRPDKYVLTPQDIQGAMWGLNQAGAKIGITGHTHVPLIAWGWIDCYTGTREIRDPSSYRNHVFDRVYFHEGPECRKWAQKNERTMKVSFSELPARLRDEQTDWQSKIIFNPGSVGQPRNYWPFASYGIITIENDSTMLAMKQVAYDIERTQSLMRDKGYPKKLIDRLAEGI